MECKPVGSVTRTEEMKMSRQIVTDATRTVYPIWFWPAMAILAVSGQAFVVIFVAMLLTR